LSRTLIAVVVAAASASAGAGVVWLLRRPAHTRAAGPPPQTSVAPVTLVAMTSDIASLAPPEPSVTMPAAVGSPPPPTVRPALTAAVATASPAGHRSHRIDVITTVVRGHFVTQGEAASAVGGMRRNLEACYDAPNCEDTGSPWCIHKDDTDLAWRVFFRRDGTVNHVYHGGGGMQVANCVGKLLPGLRVSPHPSEPGTTGGDFDEVKVVINLL
jgi:hypothetical protein